METVKGIKRKSEKTLTLTRGKSNTCQITIITIIVQNSEAMTDNTNTVLIYHAILFTSN